MLKSKSTLIVVVVLCVLALSQLACFGSGGDWKAPEGCNPGNAQNLQGQSCVKPTDVPIPTVAPKVPLNQAVEQGAYKAIDGMKQQVGNSSIGQAADALSKSPVGMPVACIKGQNPDGSCK